MRITGLFASLGIALLVSVPAWAADVTAVDLCAVSGVNGKLAAEGGVWDADGIGSNGQFQGVASLSLPLGCAFGLQFDAGAGTFGEADAVGIGGHFFTRDPNSYLLGVHATYEDWSFDTPMRDVSLVNLGVEGELYLGNISLEAWAGVQDTSRSNADAFGRLTAAFYATPDLRFAVGVRHAHDFTSGVFGAEWQVPEMPLSLTAEAEFGEDDFMSLSAGVKFYFGGDQKALIDRHRQDDPEDGLFDFIGGAAAAGAAAPAAAPPVLDGVCGNCEIIIQIP